MADADAGADEVVAGIVAKLYDDRKKIPVLVARDPFCSVRDKDLRHDGDNWCCDTCLVYWATGAWDGDKAIASLLDDSPLNLKET